MINTNIALFGATGKTGIELIELCKLNNTVFIKAFVRNPEKLKKNLVEIPQNLEIINFNLQEIASWHDQLQTCKTWISLIGISGIFQARKPNSLYENTANLLIQLGQKYNPEKTIFVTSGGVIDSPSEPWILKGFLKPLFLNPMYEDMRVMERLIQRSNLNYTIVRPPYLTNGKLRKQYRLIIEDWFNDDKVLSRKDLAHFLLKVATDRNSEYNRKIVGISY